MGEWGNGEGEGIDKGGCRYYFICYWEGRCEYPEGYRKPEAARRDGYE